MSGGKYGTSFQESEAILAVTANDHAHLDVLFAEMDRGELLALADAAHMVADCAGMAARSK